MINRDKNEVHILEFVHMSIRTKKSLIWIMHQKILSDDKNKADS